MIPVNSIGACAVVADRLGEYQAASDGRRLMARCPVHADSSPSLSVWENDNGWVNVKCHAECPTKDVLRELGLAPSDLGPGSEKYPRTRAVYDYRDAEHRLRFQVVRTDPKGFRQRVPDSDASGGFRWGLGSAEALLYRLPQVLAAVRDGQTIYVAEGEKDVHALVGAGCVATCNPMGAGKWRDAFSECLRGADVVVVQDDDDAGRKHAAQVRTSLLRVGARVRIVRPAAGKDPYDHLAAGHGVDDFVAVPEVRLVDEPPAWLVEIMGSESATVAQPEPVRPLYRTLADVLANPDAFKPPRVVASRLAWRGRVTMLAAREKLGKSTLATAAAAAVTSGREFLGEATDAGKVLWVLAEEHPGDLARRAVRFGVDPEHLVLLEQFDAPLDNLITATMEVRPKLVVIDTLFSFTAGLVKDSNASAQWGPILTTFGRLARDTEAAILLLHHASKATGEYRDSTAIGGGVDAILSMDGADDDQRRVKFKGRWELRDYTVTLTEDGYVLGAGGTPQERVLAALKANPLSLRALKDQLGVGQAKLDKVLKALIDEGYVARSGSGPNQRLMLVRDHDGKPGF